MVSDQHYGRRARLPLRRLTVATARPERLAPFVSDGLLEIDDGVLTTTLLGRIFIRNIAMVFDPYLEKQKLESRQLFSKTL